MKSKFKNVSIILCILMLCFTGCGNKEKTSKPVNGKYVSADGESYIILSDFKNGRPKGADEDVCGKANLQFVNVDLSSFLEYAIIYSTGRHIALNNLQGLNDEELDEIKKMIEERIDMENQFMDNSAEFEYFYSEMDKGYGFVCDIKGSGVDGTDESYIVVEYLADKKTIVCDEVKYILEK